MAHSCWPLLLLATVAPAVVAGQDPPRRYAAPFLASAPTIDGRLDDAVWQGVPWSDAFVDIEGGAKPARPGARE